ncbi:MAG: PorT family protein [Bacteroidales bacterium]|nr:PorT family protein [Bacteroidales bacterium]
MKKIIAVAASLLLACATSFAQFNVNLGYANSTEIYRMDKDKYSVGLNGFTVGIGYSFELAEDFYFTPSVNYQFATSRDAQLFNMGKILNVTGRVTEHYINVPLRLSYDFAFNPNFKFFVFAGPVASVGLASNWKISSTSVAAGLKEGETLDNYKDGDYKRFDIMIGGGAGLKFADQFVIKVGYDYGLINRATTNGINEHRGQLTAGIAYLF